MRHRYLATRHSNSLEAPIVRILSAVLMSLGEEISYGKLPDQNVPSDKSELAQGLPQFEARNSKQKFCLSKPAIQTLQAVKQRIA